jgi:hypothetical protein
MARQKRMDRFLVRVLAPELCQRDFFFRLQQRKPSDFFLISDDVGRLQRCDHWLPPFAEIMDRSVSPLGQVATSYSILPWLSERCLEYRQHIPPCCFAIPWLHV